jgi:hypothetical protein
MLLRRERNRQGGAAPAQASWISAIQGSSRSGFGSREGSTAPSRAISAAGQVLARAERPDAERQHPAQRAAFCIGVQRTSELCREPEAIW